MLTHLQTREYYEDLYDKTTVERCRYGERIVNATFNKMEQEVPAAEFTERQVSWYIQSAEKFAAVKQVGIS